MNALKQWFIGKFGHQCHACGVTRLLPWQEYCSLCGYKE